MFVESHKVDNVELVKRINNHVVFLFQLYLFEY